jgi:serine/threonine protein kinase
MCILIETLATIHELFIIHRDIKPDNIMFKDDKIWLIDFGMATSYTEDMIQSNNNEIIGSPKYISLNIHNGINPTRIDDMISLGYVYLFMIGSWPPRIPDIEILEINTRIDIYKKEKDFNSIIKKIVENNKIHSYLDVFYKAKFNGIPNYKKWLKLFID